MQRVLTVMKVSAGVLILLLLGLIYFHSKDFENDDRTKIPEAGPKSARPLPTDAIFHWQDKKTGQLVERRVKDYEGKVLHVVFWAEWCEPCRQETPLLEKMKAKFGDRYQIIMVDVDTNEETRNRAAEFARANAPSLPLVFDPTRTLENTYRVQGLPMHVVYDRNGLTAAMFTSGISGHPEFTKLITQLLNGK